MAHTAPHDFPTKKALREAVASGKVVRLSSPLFPPATDGVEFVEGPWRDHRWYAKVLVEDGLVVKVLS